MTSSVVASDPGANILVDRIGDCKLADFGSAQKVLIGEQNSIKIFGSVCWMAPEVIKQSGLSLSSDIWSLGATVFEMLTGFPPFSEDDGNKWVIMHKIAATDQIPYLDPTDYSKAARDFVYSCLQRNPVLRPKAKDLLNTEFLRIQEALEREGNGQKKDPQLPLDSRINEEIKVETDKLFADSKESRGFASQNNEMSLTRNRSFQPSTPGHVYSVGKNQKQVERTFSLFRGPSMMNTLSENNKNLSLEGEDQDLYQYLEVDFIPRFRVDAVEKPKLQVSSSSKTPMINSLQNQNPSAVLPSLRQLITEFGLKPQTEEPSDPPEHDPQKSGMFEIMPAENGDQIMPGDIPERQDPKKTAAYRIGANVRSAQGRFRKGTLNKVTSQNMESLTQLDDTIVNYQDSDEEKQDEPQDLNSSIHQFTEKPELFIRKKQFANKKSTGTLELI